LYASLIPATVATIAGDCGASVAIVSDAGQAAKLVGAPGVQIVSMTTDLPRWLATAAGDASAEVAVRIGALTPEDIATIAYTSGTSGRPKGAVITHGTIVAVLHSCSKAYDIGPDDVILSVLPYAHIFERIAAFMFAAVLSGAELALSRGIDHVREDIQAVRPTCMDAVPRVFEKMTHMVDREISERSALLRSIFNWSLRTARERFHAEHAGAWLRLRHSVADRLVLGRIRRQLTGGRLRFFMSGSAPLLPTVEEFFWAVGIPIYQGWGMTELTCVATCNTIDEHRLGTVGKPLAGVQIRLAADGEIEVRSPGAMKEYLGNPTATAETIVDGWLRTGDIGHIDQDGFLTITDRKKDLIKTSGGKYVAPLPIEVKLQQDAHIETAIVVGDGRRYVTALIVPDWSLLRRELGLQGAPDQLAHDPRVLSTVKKTIDEVNSGIDRFETVKYFRLLPRSLTLEADEITPSMKLKRRVVQEHFRPLIDEMYEQAA
jgi:long-chain acyl-CoA synthetase